MLTDLLLARPWLAPTTLCFLLVLGPVVGSRLVARPRLAGWLAGLASLPVLLLTVVPVDRTLFARCSVGWALPTPGRVELVANVVLFVAPVLLAGVATRRPALVLAAASVLSAVVEGLQALVTALGRSCDTSDWFCNTIGAVIGAALAWAALRLARARPAEPAAKSGASGRARRPR